MLLYIILTLLCITGSMALSLQLTDTFCKFLYGMIPIGKNLHYIFTF